MPDNTVSSPVAVTLTRRLESVATVPATTLSPLLRTTGLDSPVTMDSSMLASPVTTVPSAGMEPPGRTSTTSPTASWSGDTFTTLSPSTFSAVSGSRCASESNADDVFANERISSQCPSNMITTRSASSHQNSSSAGSKPRVAANEDPNATVMPRLMSIIMPGFRSRSSATAPVRNGLPPHTYMTVPRIGDTHSGQPSPIE